MAEKITIGLHGCDDSTFFDVEVTPEERAFVERLCERSREASSYSCQPTMDVREPVKQEVRP